MDRNKLYKIIEEYDNSPALLSEYSDSELAEYSNELLKQNKKEETEKPAASQEKNVVLPSKLKLFREIITRVEEDLGNVFEGHITIVPTITSGSKTMDLIAPSLKNGGDKQTIMMSFNISKFCRLPGLNIYSIIFAKARQQALLNKNVLRAEAEKTKSKTLTNAGLVFEGKDKADALMVSQASFVVAKYVEGFLRSYFGTNEPLGRLSQNIAKNFVAGLSPEEVREAINNNFDVSKLNDISIDFAKKNRLDGRVAETDSHDKTYSKINDARISCIQNKAEKFGLEGEDYSDAKALNFQQQADALINEDLKGKFNSLIGGGINEQNLGNLQSFCQSYADEFMRNNNLPSIKIQTYFDAKSNNFGGYNDLKTSHFIRLNLAKIKSFSELAMTLSHELTHAVDSSINKNKGKTQDGYGLINNMSEDISGSGLDKKSKAYNFLKELNGLCYKLNPNERHARSGELSGLIMMQKFGGDDPAIKEQIDKSVSKFVKYQNEVVKAASKLDIGALESKFEAFKNSGALTESATQLISERIEYLRGLQENGYLNLKDEEFSINFAKNGLEGGGNARQLKEANQNMLDEESFQRGS